MIRQAIVRVLLVLGVGAGVAAAQFASMTLGTVRITQPVLAHGQPPMTNVEHWALSIGP